jgi:integrase
VAAAVRKPTSGRVRREGRVLTLEELRALTEACKGRYRDVVPVLASGGGGALYVDTLKNNRARTVPLVLDLVPIVDRWSAGKVPDAWLFEAPEGGPLRESNWKRSVGWSAATSTVGVPGFRVHDLRHTAASVWLGAGADPKVVQRVLGHATAAMTMDLYGHMMDANLWQAARLVGDISGTFEPSEVALEDGDD